MKKLNLNVIRIDGGTQPRERINMEIVGDYAEAVKVGIEFPAVVVFHDGAEHWLADGFHRWHAHKQAGKASIEADVRPGTLLDAKLYAVGANGSHGLRRSNEDKRRAVEMVLGEPAWSAWSDRKVAEACGVSVPFVGAIRRPEVAARQQEKRAASASKQAPICNPITPPRPSRELPEPAPKAPGAAPAAAPEPEALAEVREAVSILSEENERLNDRLAVEAMDASEEEKGKAAATIAELRAELKTANAELKAVRAVRDDYMRENGTLKKMVASLQRKLKKLEEPA